MDAPNPAGFPDPRIGPERLLDRMAEKRADAEWIAARLADAESRFMLFADLSLAVDSNPGRTQTAVRWYTSEQITALGTAPPSP